MREMREMRGNVIVWKYAGNGGKAGRIIPPPPSHLLLPLAMDWKDRDLSPPPQWISCGHRATAVLGVGGERDDDVMGAGGQGLEQLMGAATRLGGKWGHWASWQTDTTEGTQRVGVG